MNIYQITILSVCLSTSETKNPYHEIKPIEAASTSGLLLIS